MVLSAKSCGIEEPFGIDISSKTEFLYQKKPKFKEEEKPLEEIIAERLAKDKAAWKKDLKQQPKEEKESILEYQMKTGAWSYKTVKEKVKGDLKKEDLLDMRVKKKHDKFCWF